MKKIALALALVVYLSSLTGCGCFRRVRGTLCRGAICGTQSAPLLSRVAAPAPAPIVVSPPAPIVAAPPVVRAPVCQPRCVQPQVVVPSCQPCTPYCQCQPPVCEPCYTGYGGDCGCSSYAGDCGCSSYGGDCGCSGYGGDCGCHGDVPFGIDVQDGEYFGGIESNDSGWETTPTEAGEEIDPGPGE